jgi:hypothetical protein
VWQTVSALEKVNHHEIINPTCFYFKITQEFRDRAASYAQSKAENDAVGLNDGAIGLVTILNHVIYF